MLVAGIDIGAATAKIVILRDSEILGYAISPVGYDVKLAANEVSKQALKNSGLSISVNDFDYIVSTGYAREAIKFANETVTEIICHAKGAHFLIPSTRFIIDMGGQDSKAIELDLEGNITNFAMNDKCAAGTGRFLEVMGNILQVESMAEMGPLALQSKEPCHISSTCTGLHKAVASRVAAMASNLSCRPDAVFTGGVAKNSGVEKFLEEEFKTKFIIPDEPQIMGALGAALIAQTRLIKQT
jgi:predicted CoA-substrate-specific enzyme activase